MSYEGRSPIKDVLRSVVMGAGMISPAVLQACATGNPPLPPPIPLGTATPTTETAATVATTPPVESAPPNEVVRPRTDPSAKQMPTRGFAGAARARG